MKTKLRALLCQKLHLASRFTNNYFGTNFLQFLAENELKIVVCLLVVSFLVVFVFVHNFFQSQRNWVFVTNSVFVKPTSLQPDDVNLWYFKLTVYDLTAFIVWNIKGLRHWFATILKLENQSLWQKLKLNLYWEPNLCLP